MEQVRDFITGIANEVARVRQNIGVKDDLNNLLTDADLRKERKDSIVQKLLRNFQYLTQSQLLKFVKLVWEKYQKS